MYIVYVLENSEGKRYTGSTRDLDGRLKMHNNETPEKARFHRTTYRKGPWKIIFTKEFDSRKEALNFERFLKSGHGREFLERARPGG